MRWRIDRLVAAELQLRALDGGLTQWRIDWLVATKLQLRELDELQLQPNSSSSKMSTQHIDLNNMGLTLPCGSPAVSSRETLEESAVVQDLKNKLKHQMSKPCKAGRFAGGPKWAGLNLIMNVQRHRFQIHGPDKGQGCGY